MDIIFPNCSIAPQAMSVNRPSGYVDPNRAAVAAAAATQALSAFQQVGSGLRAKRQPDCNVLISSMTRVCCFVTK